MAEEDKTSTEAHGDATKGKKKGFPKLAIIGILVVVLGAGGFFGMKTMGGKSKAPPAPKEGKVVALEEFLVNLADGATFLKCQMSLGMSADAPEKLVEEHTAAIRDTIITILTAKQPDQIGTPEGKLRLKSELRDALNAVLNEKMGVAVADNSHGNRNAKSGGDAASKEGQRKKDGTSKPVATPVMNIYFTAFATS